MSHFSNSPTLPTTVDTERQLLFKMLTTLNNLGGGGGGGGGTVGSVVFGNYAGGQPTFTPAAGVGLAVDTSNGTLWQFYNNAWH